MIGSKASKGRASKKKKLELLSFGITHFFLIIITVLVLVPVFWILLASLKEVGSLFSGEKYAWQGGPFLAALADFLGQMTKGMTIVNYKKLLTASDFLLWVRNSFFVCGLSSLLALCFTATAGYAFSRFSFKGRRHGLMTLIIMQMFPAVMAMVALYRLLSTLDILTGGIVGFNLLGLVLIYTGGNVAFNTWLIKGYVDSLPRELEESAYLDGATHWQTFTRVVLPLMGPILAVIGIFTFIGAYNDFLIPAIVLQNDSHFTLAVGLRGFISGRFATNWTEFAAASVMGALPILIVFLSLQKFLVEGLTKGALKG
jgi:ABC-type maltose transport system permease subunit